MLRSITTVTFALLLVTLPCYAQHDWQKPKPLVPRAHLEKIIGPVVEKQTSEPRHIVWVWGYDKNHRPGAHDYLRVRDAMLGLLKKVPGVTVDTAYGFPTKAQFDEADLVVMYLHLPQLSNEQYAMFADYIERGGGVVALHETAIMRPASEGKKLCRCLGMAWDEGRSQWGALFEDISIKNKHAVFTGFPDRLTIVDEFYWQLNREDNIEVLGEVRTGPAKHSRGPVDESKLSTEKSPVFWTHTLGKGRVFGTTTGHNTFTYFDGEFRVVLFRAMAWAMREKPDPFMPLVFDGITNDAGLVGTTNTMRDDYKNKPRRAPSE